MARRVCAGVAATLVVCSLFACSYDGGRDDYEQDDNQFRADVIECEDALARLKRCCADFDAKPVLCQFFHSESTGGCGGFATNDIQPAFSISESRCIRDTSCDALVANKVCERGQKARAYSKQTRSSSSTSSSGASASATSRPTVESVSHPPVCP